MLPTCVLDYTNSYHFTYTFYLLFYFFDLGAMTDCDLFLKTNSLNMINKSLKKNYINFSNIFYSSRHSPPTHTLLSFLFHLLISFPSPASDFLGKAGQESLIFLLVETTTAFERMMRVQY